MITSVAFLAGCAAGWLAYRMCARLGMRFISRDGKALSQLLGVLSFDALVRLRVGVDGELAKRKDAA